MNWIMAPLSMWAVILTVTLTLMPIPSTARERDGSEQADTSGSWSPISQAGAPNPAFAPLFWTGSQMLVWSNPLGGPIDAQHPGSLYSPLTRVWRPLPPSAGPISAKATWAGNQLITWTPAKGVSSTIITGSRYVPATDSWSTLPPYVSSGTCCWGAVWTGTELVIAGDPWLAYNPTTDIWRTLSWPGTPGLDYAASRSEAMLWTGSDVLLWGGPTQACVYTGVGLPPSCPTVDPSTVTNAGFLFDPVSGAVTAMSTAGAPSDRYAVPAVLWTGTDMLIWGGLGSFCTEACPLGDGALYNPASNTWRPIPSTNAPAAREGSAAVWTGSQLIIWGGTGGAGVDTLLNDGSAYAPATSTWTTLPATGAPSPRIARAVWTGTHMIVWGGIQGTTLLADGAVYTSPAPHDARYFSQTSYRIDNDTIWDYFQHRGGVPTFGYPTSRTLTFLGFTTQFFQRAVIQLGPTGQAQLLNLLDPPFLPYSSFNSSSFPLSDPSLVATAPPLSDQPALLAWIQSHAPDYLDGRPTLFSHTFLSTVPLTAAFPVGGDPGLLPGFDLEIWGLPTSAPLVDPRNSAFVFLRWQRGVMLYDQGCVCIQGVLLGDYLKDILTGEHLPADLASEAASSPFLDQYDPTAPSWVHNPTLLPGTDLTMAFVPE